MSAYLYIQPLFVFSVSQSISLCEVGDHLWISGGHCEWSLSGRHRQKELHTELKSAGPSCVGVHRVPGCWGWRGAELEPTARRGSIPGGSNFVRTTLEMSYLNDLASLFLLTDSNLDSIPIKCLTSLRWKTGAGSLLLLLEIKTRRSKDTLF